MLRSLSTVSVFLSGIFLVVYEVFDIPLPPFAVGMAGVLLMLAAVERATR